VAISLSKGQKIDLTKGNAGLSKINVGLGWDTNKYDGGADFDLDASAFLLGANGKVTKDEDFVFYKAKLHPSGSVECGPDNQTGEGEGDDEHIDVDLSMVPPVYQKIAFVATIYDSEARKQNFGQVNNAYIRIVNAVNGVEIMRYDLAEEFSTETAVIVAELFRDDAEWKFQAIGNGLKGGLMAVCSKFGIDAN
jgi:tellurium resistance protein TerD